MKITGVDPGAVTEQNTYKPSVSEERKMNSGLKILIPEH